MAIKFDVPCKKVAFSASNNTARANATASAGASADHTRLNNRDAADQHPISAITGLQSVLNEKANADDIPSLDGYATEAYVNGHHDSTKQDTLTAGENITIENSVISATGGGASSWDGLTDKPFDTIDDNTLIVRDGVLAVNTTDIAEQDNTKPITSSGVHVIVGNIDTLLSLI